MKHKLLFGLLIVSVFTACKKEPQSSPAITGKWKLLISYYVTIAGTQKEVPSPLKPVILNFEGTTYTRTEKDDVKDTGPYELVKNYVISPGDVDNVLKVNGTANSRYEMRQGAPDTLNLSSIDRGPDFGASAVYLRVK